MPQAVGILAKTWGLFLEIGRERTLTCYVMKDFSVLPQSLARVGWELLWATFGGGETRQEADRRLALGPYKRDTMSVGMLLNGTRPMRLHQFHEGARG